MKHINNTNFLRKGSKLAIRSKFISTALIVLIIFTCNTLFAATVVLKNGATVIGKLVSKTATEITIEDKWTKQLKAIKVELIRDLTLDPEEQKIEEEKKKSADTLKGDLLYVLNPSFGLLAGIAYPFGNVGKNVAIGYGASLFSDVALPMKTTMFKIRLGLSAGFMYHQTKSSDFAPNLQIIPIVIYAKFQFITAPGLRPYIKLGGGYSPIMSSGGNSFDPTVAAAVGLGYVNNKIPFLEFFIEAGMTMFFEKTRGDFITAHVGIAYRFGAGSNVSQ